MTTSHTETCDKTSAAMAIYQLLLRLFSFFMETVGYSLAVQSDMSAVMVVMCSAVVRLVFRLGNRGCSLRQGVVSGAQEWLVFCVGAA